MLALAALVGVAGLVLYAALPTIASWYVQRELAARGYPGATFAVAFVGMDALELRDVRLADGIELGAVDIGLGVSSLWRERTPSVVIRGARIDARAVRDESGGGSGTAEPFVAVIENSVVAIDGVTAVVDGIVSRGLGLPTAIVARTEAVGPLQDIEVAIAKATRGFNACGNARVHGADVGACADVAMEKGAAVLGDVAWAAVDRARGWSAHGDGGGRIGASGSEVDVKGQLTNGAADVEGSGRLVAGPMFTQPRAEIAWTATHAKPWAMQAKAGWPAARGTAWTASGTNQITVEAREVTMRGRVELAVPELVVGRVAIRGAKATLELASAPQMPVLAQWTPELWARGIEVRATGEATADGVVVRGYRSQSTFRGARMPLALVASKHGITATRPLVARARDGRTLVGGEPLVAKAPEVTLIAKAGALELPPVLAWKAGAASWHGATAAGAKGEITLGKTLRWEARDTVMGTTRIDGLRGVVDLRTGHDDHTFAWFSLSGRFGLTAGAGDVVVRGGDDVTIMRAHVQGVFGGELDAAPLAGGAKGELAVQARGLDVQRIIAVAGRERIAGTGVLDGDLVVRIGLDGWSQLRGQLRARGPGVLRVVDPAWRAKLAANAAAQPPKTQSLAAQKKAVVQSITGALADFQYNRLALGFAPRGGVRIGVAGRGVHVPQMFDLVVNVSVPKQ